MGTFLFDQIVFGPVNSRRLGVSLGMNLLPLDKKICTFNCIYCECGWTLKEIDKSQFHSPEKIFQALESRLKQMADKGDPLDVITFAGNGEPTLHPDFDKIMDDTLRLRDQWFPSADVAVLSNASMISDNKVFHALQKADKNILKLDSVFQDTVDMINQPIIRFRIEETIENLVRFNGNLIIQTLFLRGQFHGHIIDNTTDEEVAAWINALKRIQPGELMIYTISRDTPAPALKPVSLEALQNIADQARAALGIPVDVAG